MKILLLILIITGPAIYRTSWPDIAAESQDELPKSIERGKEIYSANCMSCHQLNGQGLSGVYPPLAGSDHLSKDQKKSVDVILRGLDEEINVNGITYNIPMTPLDHLTDREIADVLNYIGNSWGNHLNAVLPDDVESRRN